MPDTQRSCGPCTACCTACEVVELNKPMNTPCLHLTPTGCSIYEIRPPSCRAFECLWLRGGGGDQHRPDLIGVLYAKMQHGNHRPYALVAEIVEGAADNPITRRLREVTPIVLSRPTGTDCYVLGPDPNQPLADILREIGVDPKPDAP